MNKQYLKIIGSGRGFGIGHSGQFVVDVAEMMLPMEDLKYLIAETDNWPRRRCVGDYIITAIRVGVRWGFG